MKPLIVAQIVAATVGFVLATSLPAQHARTADEESRRSNPDVIVYLPKGAEYHDGDNETFLVVPVPRSDELLGIWTQSSVEGRRPRR